MNKIFTLFAGLLLVTCLFGQASDRMNYQAVVRNAEGEILKDQAIGVRVVILEGSIDGDLVFEETHTVTSNANGLISFSIGDGDGSDSLLNVDWSNNKHYILTEFDLEGGTDYTLSSTEELTAVPYAIHSEDAYSSQYSIHSESADYADSSHSAYESIHSESADYADSSLSAYESIHSGSADYADSSHSAYESVYSGSADYADSSHSAYESIHSDSADYADSSLSAYESIHSDSADYADSSQSAYESVHSDSADYTDSSAVAHLADSVDGMPMITHEDTALWNSTDTAWVDNGETVYTMKKVNIGNPTDWNNVTLHVDDSLQYGIYLTTISQETTSNYGIHSKAIGITTGNNYGFRGIASGGDVNVGGEFSATVEGSEVGYGSVSNVMGESSSTLYGVIGNTSSSTTINIGVNGWTQGTAPKNVGLFGEAVGAGNNNYGIEAIANSATDTSFGIFSEVTSSNSAVGLGFDIDVKGSTSGDQYGGRVYVGGSSVKNVGMFSEVTSDNSSSNSSQENYGIKAVAKGTGAGYHAGVHGVGGDEVASDVVYYDVNYGVLGTSTGTEIDVNGKSANYGVGGVASGNINGNYAVDGTANSAVGDNFGVSGYAVGSADNYGVLGFANNSEEANIAVYGVVGDNVSGTIYNYAGYFTGAPVKADNSFVVSDSAHGMILTSPDGTCYLITVENGGSLSTNSVTCP